MVEHKLPYDSYYTEFTVTSQEVLLRYHHLRPHKRQTNAKPHNPENKNKKKIARSKMKLKQ